MSGYFFCQITCYAFGKSHWYCIANPTPNSLEAGKHEIREEFVVNWKRLQKCCLSQGNRPVLLRVTKSTIAISVTLGCDRWCRAILAHSSVDTTISSPFLASMTLGNEIIRPVVPATARCRLLDSSNIDR